MPNEMHYMWVFVVLSLIVGATFGLVLGMKSPTGAAIAPQQQIIPFPTTSGGLQQVVTPYSANMNQQIENMLLKSNGPVGTAVKNLIVDYVKDTYTKFTDALAIQVKEENIDQGTYYAVTNQVTNQIVETLVNDNVISVQDKDQFKGELNEQATQSLIDAGVETVATQQ